MLPYIRMEWNLQKIGGQNMNLKKRGLALLMCICMIMTLLPAAAFADDAAVVYGKYDASDTWQQDPSATGTVTYPVDGGNSLA